jgi:hypothetical protein
MIAGEPPGTFIDPQVCPIFHLHKGVLLSPSLQASATSVRRERHSSGSANQAMYWTWRKFASSVDSARYRGDSLFSTEVVKNRSPRSSCSAAASSSATIASSILYLPSLTSALFTVMSRSAPA